MLYDFYTPACYDPDLGISCLCGGLDDKKSCQGCRSLVIRDSEADCDSCCRNFDYSYDLSCEG